eukprot:IDg5629t1
MTASFHRLGVVRTRPHSVGYLYWTYLEARHLVTQCWVNSLELSVAPCGICFLEYPALDLMIVLIVFWVSAGFPLFSAVLNLSKLLFLDSLTRARIRRFAALYWSQWMFSPDLFACLYSSDLFVAILSRVGVQKNLYLGR